METTGIVVASIVGFIAFFFVALYTSSFRMRRAGKRFLTLLMKRNFDAAYEMLTPRVAGRHSKARVRAVPLGKSVIQPSILQPSRLLDRSWPRRLQTDSHS